MFDRLINSFGQPANQHSRNIMQDSELQLAAVQLLFSVLPVDYRVTPDEGCALVKSIKSLFGFSPEKCHRLIARAAAAHSRDSNIMAAATLLKSRTTLAFRQQLLAEINLIMRADGVLHENELDLEHRVERLLGLTTPDSRQIA
jgi:uncharacterized tellurite resistance protein B-like protein